MALPSGAETIPTFYLVKLPGLPNQKDWLDTWEAKSPISI